MSQQPALDVERITIRTMHETAQSGFAHHAMAGNNDGNRIVAAGLSHSTRAGTKLRSHLPVGQSVSARNGTHRLPNFALMLSTIELERQIEMKIRIGQISLQLPAYFLCQNIAWK